MAHFIAFHRSPGSRRHPCTHILFDGPIETDSLPTFFFRRSERKYAIAERLADLEEEKSASSRLSDLEDDGQ